jgi:RNA polymerase sigma-70 factor (ECF subfamily)
VAGEKGSSLIYCLIPRELAAALHDALRDHFRDEPGVEVVVELRRESRRRQGDRRRSDEATLPGPDRRRIRSKGGRRVADRRAITTPVEPPPLPAEMAPLAGRLVFIDRLEPSDQATLDADTKRLVARFQSGEQEIFDEIYMRHFGSVYGYAHAAVRNGPEAEDVAQEVFLRALQALPDYEIRSVAFRSWLLRIARNAVMDSLRRSRRLVVEDPSVLTSRTEALRPDHGQSGLEWVSRREIARRVERLPRAQREVIVLRYLLDLPYEEIAGLTDQTPRAARHLHSRAIRILNQ